MIQILFFVLESLLFFEFTISDCVLVLLQQSASDCDNTSCEDFSVLSFDHSSDSKQNGSSRRGSENCSSVVKSTFLSLPFGFGGKKDQPPTITHPLIKPYPNATKVLVSILTATHKSFLLTTHLPISQCLKNIFQILF